MNEKTNDFNSFILRLPKSRQWYFMYQINVKFAEEVSAKFSGQWSSDNGSRFGWYKHDFVCFLVAWKNTSWLATYGHVLHGRMSKSKLPLVIFPIKRAQPKKKKEVTWIVILLFLILLDRVHLIQFEQKVVKCSFSVNLKRPCYICYCRPFFKWTKTANSVQRSPLALR